MQFLTAVVLVWCLSFVPTFADDDGKVSPPTRPSFDAAGFNYDGVWKPKGAMLAGTLLPPPALAGVTLTIRKRHYEVTIEGEDHSDTGTFKVDEITTPMRMAIKSESGPNKGKTILAIYEIKGANAMRVCYDLSGKEYPKEFKAPKGTQRYLVGYRRRTSKAKGSDKTTTQKKDQAPADSPDN